MSGRRSRRLRAIALRLNPKHTRLVHRRLKKLWNLRKSAMFLYASVDLEPRP